jgi:hypothetical protein
LTQGQPKVLLLAAKWWPLSARLAAALHRHGCHVRALCPAGHPLTHVRGIRHIDRYAGIFSLASVRRAVRDGQPEIIVPCDDGAVAQLHALHRLDPSMRELIERSLGPPESYPVVDSRFKFLSMAIELGIRVPRTRTVETAADLANWHQTARAAVIKVDGECGGNGVRISRSLGESVLAWRALRARPAAATAWKRLAIDRDPLALWLRRNGNRREVTVQEYIAGRPANSMLACWRGELLSMTSVDVVAADGPTGAATVVRVIQDESMRQAANLVVSRLKLSGFYGLDYVIEASTGAPYLIEINPRCTQLGHLELPGQGSLAGVLSAALRGETRPPAQNPIRGNTIALFPQALAAGGTCRAHVYASYHDVPYEEPQLLQELMQKPWPQRRWASRLYHVFRPASRPEPILFEDAEPSAGGVDRVVAAAAN